MMLEHCVHVGSPASALDSHIQPTCRRRVDHVSADLSFLHFGFGQITDADNRLAAKVLA
jgi:hypothetical protein